jgi:hypothetical protein
VQPFGRVWGPFPRHMSNVIRIADFGSKARKTKTPMADEQLALLLRQLYTEPPVWLSMSASQRLVFVKRLEL